MRPMAIRIVCRRLHFAARLNKAAGAPPARMSSKWGVAMMLTACNARSRPGHGTRAVGNEITARIYTRRQHISNVRNCVAMTSWPYHGEMGFKQLRSHRHKRRAKHGRSERKLIGMPCVAANASSMGVSASKKASSWH